MSIAWNYNGQKISEIEFENGQQSGSYRSWYDNGQQKMEGFYKDDKENGKWVYWYDNGQKEKEGDLKAGTREGQWNFWAQDGRKLVEVLSDSFNDNSLNWEEIDDEMVTVSIQAGHFEVDNRSDKIYTYSRYIDKINHENFIMKVDATYYSGVDDSGYGIVWGVNANNESYNLFIINASYGQYLRSTNHDISRSKWKESNYIHRGNMTNNIMINKMKNETELYINDNLIEIWANNDFFGNAIGFRVDDKHKIGFDNISILQ